MPVKNTKRRTNDGLEGVITGLTEEEKKVLEDAGIGGGTAVEANPQEEATQQLEKIKIDNIAYNIAAGGSGGEENYNIEVTDVVLKSAYFAISTDVKWVDGAGLQPNSAYEVGDIVKIEYTGIFQSVNCETTNKIFMPLSIFPVVAKSNSRLQFGDVVLVLTNGTARLNCSSSDKKIYDITCDNILTYAVVKSGTTADSVAITNTGLFQDALRYNIVTLGVTKTTA